MNNIKAQKKIFTSWQETPSLLHSMALTALMKREQHGYNGRVRWFRYMRCTEPCGFVRQESHCCLCIPRALSAQGPTDAWHQEEE